MSSGPRAIRVEVVGKREEAFGRIEREIRQAQAEALGRTGERIEALLTHLAELDQRLLAFRHERPLDPDGERRLRTEAAARDRVRDEAARLVHYLIIQREALGLVRHGAVEERYPAPPRHPAKQDLTPAVLQRAEPRSSGPSGLPRREGTVPRVVRQTAARNVR